MVATETELHTYGEGSDLGENSDEDELPPLIRRSYNSDDENDSDEEIAQDKQTNRRSDSKYNKIMQRTKAYTNTTNKDEKEKKNKRKRKKIHDKRTVITNRPNREENDQLNLEKAKKKETIKRTIQQLTEEEINNKGILEPWGDQLTIQDNWPRENKEERLRIITINLNGISSQANYLEWEIILGNMADLQADIFVIQEANLDFRGRVRDEVRQKAKQFDKHMRIFMESSKQEPNKRGSTYKPGGTMIGVTGAWSGRLKNIEEPNTKDTLGRWSVCHLIGKAGKTISVISLYRVCAQKHNIGSNTLYMQQQLDIEKKNKRISDPREQICTDIEAYIQSLHEMGHTVILAGDTNENMGKRNNRIEKMLENAGMNNIMEERKGEKALPITYDRGQHCLDIIAISSHTKRGTIQAAGYLPFYQPFASDHRVAYTDLNAKEIFGKTKPDTTRPIYHTFHTSNK